MNWPLQYATVEACLTHMHGIDEALRPRFSARCVNFLREGLLGEENRPGTGTRREYERDDVNKMIFALELSEVGIAPQVVIWIANSGLWTEIGEAFARAWKGPDDIWVSLFDVRIMTAQWNGSAPFRVQVFELTIATGFTPVDGGRALTFGISALVRNFNRALATLPRGRRRSEPIDGLLANLG